MVELRKRKAHQEPATTQVKKTKATEKTATTKTARKNANPPAVAAVAAPETSSKVPKVGDSLSLDGFGGEVETHEGVKTTLKQLVEESKAGVVLFTYPKASTPGCTKQACMFRDGYKELTATGLSLYGLSTDSPKANTTFKTKQTLPYALLCDPQATLIGAIGLKKTPKGTIRGVFVVNKEGKVEVLEPGSPVSTVDAVHKLVTQKPAEGA